MSPSRIRLIAALAFVMPVTALVAAPAMAASKNHVTHHAAKTHKPTRKAKATSSH